ncbi:LysE family transporter [Shinella pollutisoli]|uniref:LysE family transporter n=1 Tax=Shinella pollutisoli TaxID=2250594 RepID=A0ABV7DEF0_9HYPH
MVTLAFLTTSLVLLLTPGPTNTLLAAYGAAFGWRSGAVMVLAEALGYAVAVSFFASIAGVLTGLPAGLSVLKLAAAAWLLFSAVQLWRSRIAEKVEPPAHAFARVLATTLLNPKAMIVGVVLIPGGGSAELSLWIGAYVLLSMTAGLAWVLAGSLLPRGVRKHAYQGAAVVLSGFSLAAVASVVG